VIDEYTHIPFKAEPTGQYQGYVLCPIATHRESDLSTEEIFSPFDLANRARTIEIQPARRNRFARKLKELRALAPDPQSQRKYTKTLAWIDSLGPNAFLEIAQMKREGVALYALRVNSKEELDNWFLAWAKWRDNVLETLRLRFSEVHALHFENLGPIEGSHHGHQFDDSHGHKLSMLARQLEILGALIEKNF
jgi:hypothetical protein